MHGAPLSSIPCAALVLPVFHLASISPQNLVKKKIMKYGVTKSHQESLVWKVLDIEETRKNDACHEEGDGEYITLRSQNESSIKCYGKYSTARYRSLTNPQQSGAWHTEPIDLCRICAVVHLLKM
ncbi:hypothetical protein GRJ2_001201800 [Grus japonensis]|uniref:Uncharacterized protein n=1 Tax=Grus japonensis TaxID=30415 RepID=A0ABC9WQC7_GRUJA